jgi:hypothetical protein
VEQTLELDGSELLICKIHHVMVFEKLMDNSISIEERMKLASPALSAGRGLSSYFSVNLWSSANGEKRNSVCDIVRKGLCRK